MSLRDGVRDVVLQAGRQDSGKASSQEVAKWFHDMLALHDIFWHDTLLF
jgi:hypothetical protein